VRTPSIPASCRDLDHDHVVKVFAACNANVGDAARRLHVPSADFRRFVIANPELMAVVFERVELRLDKAEAILERELDSSDPRYSAAAAFFVLRNARRAAERGWRQADATVTVNNNTAVQHNVVYRWRTEADDKRDEEARLKEAEEDRHYAEQGKKVISVGWSRPASEEAPKDQSPDLFEDLSKYSI
jgi:hypothetical protein